MAKRLPKPYQRPQVTLAASTSREWRYVLPWELEVGDTIGGFGEIGHIEDLGSGYVRLTNLVTGQREAKPTGRAIYAFVKASDPARADS